MESSRDSGLLALSPLLVLAHVAEEAPGLFVSATVSICRVSRVRPGAAVLAAAVGALPMVAHGIGIIAFGRPLLW